MVEEGDKAPDFELPTESGETLKLSSLKGKPVVLYFYPKDDTSGCTAEAKDFSRLAPDFRKAGVEVIGVSPDSVASHQKFRKKYDLDDPPRRRRRQGRGDGLWRVGREVDVRAQVHGRRALHLPDRQEGPHRQELAQGQGAGPRRGGARRGQGVWASRGPLTSSFRGRVQWLIRRGELVEPRGHDRNPFTALRPAQGSVERAAPLQAAVHRTGRFCRPRKAQPVMRKVWRYRAPTPEGVRTGSVARHPRPWRVKPRPRRRSAVLRRRQWPWRCRGRHRSSRRARNEPHRGWPLRT